MGDYPPLYPEDQKMIFILYYFILYYIYLFIIFVVVVVVKSRESRGL